MYRALKEDLEIVKNFKIYGDLDFLGIALKNLIENAKKIYTNIENPFIGIKSTNS